jgi:uncharacterized protein (TIGR02246 family)
MHHSILRDGAVLLACGVLLCGCSPSADRQETAAPTRSAQEIVAELTSAWLKAYNAGDLDGLMRLYAEDASLHMPTAPAIWGTQAIRDYWREDMSGGARTEIDLGGAYSAGDLTYVEGEYRVFNAANTQLVGGDFVQLWQLRNGAWKIINDNWHSHEVGHDPTAGNALASRLTASWTQAYNSGDSSNVAALYAADARLTMPGEATFEGHDDIDAFWMDDMSAGESKTALDLRDAYVEGGLAHLEGTYTVTGSGGAPLATGEYLQLWVRDGDDWRIHREMWSANPIP